LFERLQREESVIFAVIENETALGFTQLYPSFSSALMKPIWILNDLFVVKQARRLGIASRLLTAARNHGLQTGAAYLELTTTVGNTASQALYEGKGWQRDTGSLRYKLEMPSGAIRMSDTLDDIAHPSRIA
jgi:GNAT superfamily N-acetyltransferase